MPVNAEEFSGSTCCTNSREIQGSQAAGEGQRSEMFYRTGTAVGR